MAPHDFMLKSPATPPALRKNESQSPEEPLLSPRSFILGPAFCLPFLTLLVSQRWEELPHSRSTCDPQISVKSHLKPNHYFFFHPFICLSVSYSDGVT